MVDKDKWLRIYLKARGKITKIESYTEAQEYAIQLGEKMAEIVGEADFSSMTEAEIADLLRPILKQAQGDALKAARLAQDAQNRALGLGIGTLEAEIDNSAAAAVAEAIAGKEATKDYLAKVLSKKTIETVDETMRKNVQARDEMGLTVHIVRRYSDVGLRAGTPYAEPCQWCLSRCGEWDNYQAAKAAGCFERHEGCQCQIEYVAGKTHTKRIGGTWVKK